jgi:hypothetical protein
MRISAQIGLSDLSQAPREAIFSRPEYHAQWHEGSFFAVLGLN